MFTFQFNDVLKESIGKKGKKLENNWNKIYKKNRFKINNIQNEEFENMYIMIFERLNPPE